MTATVDQITQLRRHALNHVTREIMKNGVKLTWDQAYDLGDEVIDWMRSRLGLKSTSSDRGLTFRPDPEILAGTHDGTSGAKQAHAAKKAGQVTVETMPEYLKDSHRVARNWGIYPHNGAVRERVTRDEAEEIIAEDPDGYAHIVGERGL